MQATLLNHAQLNSDNKHSVRTFANVIVFGLYMTNELNH